MNDRLVAALADRYRIERELGQGGMATVYLAQDLKHDRKVAVKVLRPELAAVIGADRFLSEIKTTANLQHPHILPLFDSGSADSVLFYVMPFIEGESLRDRLNREKQLPVSDAVRMAIEVAGALDYAHRHGVIHRDIKPENILLHDGRALVADFGIALAASKAGGSRMTETGMSLGTPHYMSPEQAMGEREIGPQSDVYALGAVTYEMLVGEPPFTGPTAQAIVAKVMTAEPADITGQRRTVPPYVDAAVLTALEKLPADRWPTAAAFILALQGQAAVTRSRTGRGERVPSNSWSMGSPFPWALGCGLALIAAAWGWWPAQTTDPPPVIRLEMQSDPGTQLAFPVSGTGTQIAISPDGHRAIFAAGRSSGSWMLFIRNLDQLSSRALPGTEGAYNPEFSPDGRWVAFRSSDGKLKRISTDGAGLTTLCAIDNSGNVGAGLTWLSNREIVFAKGSYSEGRGLWRVSSEGGEPVQFSRMDSASGERLQLAPRAADGGRLVFYASTIASNADLRIGVVEVATGKATVFSELRGARAVGLIEGFLVYVRNDGTLMAAPFDVGSLRAGSPLEIADSIAVTSSAWHTPVALSPSGSLFYQKGGIGGQLVSVNQQGVTRVLLDSVQVYLHPRLSPDGRRLAVEVQGANGADIWIADLGEHTFARLTREEYNNRPEWSPDGSRVMFTSSREPGDALWWQPADGSITAEMLHHVTDPIREGVFTPDGRSVLYRTDSRESNRDIYRFSLAGDRTSVPVLVNMNDDKLPRVSPDSRWLAYVSNESGREEVYVRPLSGGGGRVAVSNSGGGEPLWSPDGKRIYYRAGARLIAATIAVSPALAVLARDTLFEGPFATDIFHPNYDVARDGSFVMIRPVEENRQLVMVVNWIQELRRRTGGRQ